MASPAPGSPAATLARRRVFETVLREQSLHYAGLLRDAYLPYQTAEAFRRVGRGLETHGCHFMERNANECGGFDDLGAEYGVEGRTPVRAPLMFCPVSCKCTSSTPGCASACPAKVY